MNKMLLLILDGWGLGQAHDHNAIAAMNPPYWQTLMATYPHCGLSAREASVGLLPGFLSNSEVGHITIGAGRVVPQSAFAIARAIEDKTLYQSPVLATMATQILERGCTLHLVGLLSDGGVHAHLSHLLALIAWAKEHHLPRVALHLFLDGRDMAPRSAGPLLSTVESALPPEYHIASLVGRAIAMDRAEQWDRTVTTARLLTTADGTSTIDPVEYLQAQYAENIGDEFIPGVHCTDDVIRAGDAVLFFNFRADRMRQLGKLFLGLAPHTIASTVTIPDDLLLASMTSYDDAFTRMPVIFPKTTTKNNLGEWVSVQGGRQLRLAETEKYAHVTYFINGGEEIKYPNEERLMVPSLGLKNYADHPEMSLPELSNTLIHALGQQHADLIICNIANGDMVGHSGDLAAAKRAVVHVDEALSRIIPSANANGYTTLVTADHGNIESMVEDNAPHTAHTFNHVPCIVTRPGITLRDGHLHEVAPTILALMGLPQPPEMTSQSLIVS